MNTYCAIYDGAVLAIGDRSTVLLMAYNWRIDEARRLILHPKNYDPSVFHAYSNEYSWDEIRCDVERFLLSSLIQSAYRIQVFQSIG